MKSFRSDQRLYFLPYLAMSGWDVSAPQAAPVIPYSLPLTEKPAPVRNDRLVYGGFLLPWQDPSIGIGALLEALEARDRGRFRFVGGPHPAGDVSRGRFDTILDRIAASPRAAIESPMPFDSLTGELRRCGVAENAKRA